MVELFDNEILTRLNNPKRGRVVIIAHRVNEDDLLGAPVRAGGVEALEAAVDCHAPAELQAPDGVWVREKGELLRPHAFTQRDIELLQAAKRPGFETCQQQNPGGTKLRIKADTLGTFPRRWFRCPIPVSCSASIPGQKGGPRTVSRSSRPGCQSAAITCCWSSGGSKRTIRVLREAVPE